MRRVFLFISILVLLGASLLVVTVDAIEPNLLLSQPTTTASWPAIAADDRGIYVVWQDRGLGDYDIVMSMSKNNGTTFSEPVFVNDNPGDGSHSSFPDVAVANGKVYVVWEDSRNGISDIYISCSDDGKSFSTSIPVWQSATNSSNRPSITVDRNSGLIFVAWVDDYLHVRASTSANGGQTFSTPVTISDSVKNGRYDPEIKVDSKGKVYVVWADGRTGKVQQGPFNVDDTDVFISNSTDGGNSFGPNIRVNQEYVDTIQSHPSIAIDGNDILHVVWDDEIVYGEPSILYSKSANGMDFTNPVFANFTSRLTDGRGTTHQTPVVEVARSGDIVYVSWAEIRSGNYNIYLARFEGSGFFSTVELYGGNYFFDDAASFDGYRNPGEAVLADNGNGRLDPGKLDGTESPDEIVLAGRANIQEDITGERLVFFDQDSDGWGYDDDIVREHPVISYPSIEPKLKSQWDTTTGTYVNYLRLVDGFNYDVEQSETMSIGGFDIRHAKDAGVNPENFGLESGEPISKAEVEITYRTEASYDGSAFVNISKGLSLNISTIAIANTGGIEETATVDLMPLGFWTIPDLKTLNVSFMNDASSSQTVSFNKISLWIDRGLPGRFDAYDVTVYDGSAILTFNQSLSAFADDDDVMFIDASMDGHYDLGEPLLLTTTDLEPGQPITGAEIVLPRADRPHWEPAFAPFPLNDDASTTPQYAPDIALDSGGGCYAVWVDYRAIVSSVYFGDTVPDSWPPYVQDVYPDHGSVDITPNTDIQMTFSEPVDTHSLESAFSIFPPTAGTWNWSAEGDYATFEPLFPLLPETTYHVEIGSSVVDLSGNALKDRLRWQFNTATLPTFNCHFNETWSPFADLPVVCSVTDKWGVVSVTLHYREATGENYTVFDLDLTSGSATLGTWEGVIPAIMNVGLIHFFLKAVSTVDAAARYPMSGDAIVKILDTVPPELHHSAVESASPGSTINITATASDDIGIQSVTLHTKPVDGTAFVAHEMKRLGQTDTYYVLVEIPDRNGIVEYYIRAIDAGGNQATSPQSYPQTGPHEIEISGVSDQSAYVWVASAIILCLVIALSVLYVIRSRRAKD